MFGTPLLPQASSARDDLPRPAGRWPRSAAVCLLPPNSEGADRHAAGKRGVGRNGFAEGAGIEDVEWAGECILSDDGQGCPSELQREETTMSPLRARMIEDMSLAGLGHRNAENLCPGSAQTGRALPSIA